MTPGLAENVASVLIACTDVHPEIAETVKISRDGKLRNAVMRLGPASIEQMGVPGLAPGDRLEFSAELEVTHDSPLAGAADLVGKPYSYEPTIDAWLYLTSAEKGPLADLKHAIRIGKPQHEVCKVQQHHVRLVFPWDHYDVPKKGLPWTGPSQIVMLLAAHHPSALEGHLLLIGQNEPKTPTEPAHAEGDQGRINVARFRGKPHAKPTKTQSKQPVAREIARDKNQVVLYSVPIDDLVAGEQLLVDSSFSVHNPHHDEARITTEIVITDAPKGTGLHGAKRDRITCKGQLAKSNGSNCLPDSSYVTKKVGAGRVLKEMKGTSYVNLVAVSSNPETKTPDAKTIKIESGGFLDVRRFPSGSLGRD